MKIRNIFTQNYDKNKRSINSIKLIVIHYTGMQSERESIDRLCNPKAKVSSHYLINRKGKIIQLVKESYVAWHAGKSCWNKLRNLNKYSIGIELVNKGHKFGYENFNKKQISSLIWLCKKLIKKYNIRKENIVGHSDIAPLRKIDPGEKFPWQHLAKNKVGFWYNFDQNVLKKYRKLQVSEKKNTKTFFKKLEKIGYCVFFKKKDYKPKIISAFQRRFRNKLINGKLDYECLMIAINLTKKH